MATSSEEVLLIVKKVRQKKQDGALYLMAERIAWAPEGKDRFIISHTYADIKCQKISPDGKAKVQLQLVLHSGENSNFHFSNDVTAIKERDAVKELLRHFWSCFPVNTLFLEEKVIKMKSNLERFQVTKLRPFQEKLRKQYLGTNLTSHMEEMLQTAYSKFHTWQSRRLIKKT
uniref:General transcription factor IIH subunit 1 n=1 Tax=Xenopus laevis TaxID=8355 RepID=Q5HZS8_XENLA|nr:Unknown (protein for MGC:85177) [Xenopus laevis]